MGSLDGAGGSREEELTACGAGGGAAGRDRGAAGLVLGKVVPGIPGRERPRGWHDGDGCKVRTNSPP